MNPSLSCSASVWRAREEEKCRNQYNRKPEDVQHIRKERACYTAESLSDEGFPRSALRYPENRSGLRCSSDSPTAAVIPQCLPLPPAAALRDSAMRRTSARRRTKAEQTASFSAPSVYDLSYTIACKTDSHMRIKSQQLTVMSAACKLTADEAQHTPALGVSVRQ